jgi:AsmA protein
MRKLAIALGVIVLIVIVGALVFAATFDVNKYRGTIQSQLQERLGRHTNLGNMHLSVFPPRFRVQDVVIADDPSFNSAAPFVQAQELAVSVKLLPLLRKQVEIDSLELERPVVSLIRNRQGDWNFDSLGKAAGPGNPSQPQQPAQPPSAQNAPAESQAPSSGQVPFTLGRLSIRDGQVSFLDQEVRCAACRV